MFFSRKDPLKEARSDTVAAIRLAVKELQERQPMGELFGFALCTDDDLRTLYHVACTRAWVREREAGYPGIGYIFVEWEDSASDGLFERVSCQFASLADESHASDTAWAEARDLRFAALTHALEECRREQLFHEETLLCIGSTDPSEHLEALAMDAVDRLNSRKIADLFARHLGYEQHRKKPDQPP